MQKVAIETQMKRRYADALVALCERGADLAKLSVADVAAEAQTSRQTFYRHFSDMDDLVCYAGSRPFLTGEYPYMSPDNVRYAFEHFVRHKAFFCQLPSCRGVNGFRETYLGWQKKMMYRLFLTGDLDERERAYRKTCIDIYESGTVDALLEWLKEGMARPVDVFVKALADCTPPFMDCQIESLHAEFFPPDYAR